MMTDLATLPKTIGGSRAAAVFGAAPPTWTPSTPLEVYLELVGELPEQQDSEAMEWGRALEEPVAQKYSRVTGFKVRRLSAELKHKDHPFLTGHLDRIVVGEQRVLEVKTGGVWAGEGWGDPGTDQIPPHYLCQCVHYLALTKAVACDVAVLLGGQRFAIYTVPRDEELIELHVRRLVWFWRTYVERRSPPPPQTFNDFRYVKRDGQVLEATEADIELVRSFEESKRLAKAADDEKKARQRAIYERMGTAEELRVPGRLKSIATCHPIRQLDEEALRAAHPDIWEAHRSFDIGSAEAAGHKPILDQYRRPTGAPRLYTNLENA